MLFALFANWYNRSRGGQFFYDDEYWFIAVSIFLVGHPLWIFYIVAIFAVHFLGSFFYFVILRRNEKLPFYYLWFLVAAGVILLGEALQITALFGSLKF